MMEMPRIAILSAYDEVCAFLDNSLDDTLHYWDDNLHTYLQGSAYTFEFTTESWKEDATYLVEGNHLSFKYKDKGYYLNIVETEKDELEVKVTAYGLVFELLNEEVDTYEGTSMSFEAYVKAFNYEKSFDIGINEVSDKRISNKWEGTDTVLKRLYSLATVFGAELEFVTHLNDDYSLNKIVLNVYREHDDTHQGMGQNRTGEVLRYGKEVTGITKKSDITELCTAIRPTGKDGLQLNKLSGKKEYDSDGNVEFQVSGNNLLAPQARDRFPSLLKSSANDRYIVKIWSYDTSDVNVLYGQAKAELAKIMVPKVSYEVESYVDANIGDTFTIEDADYTPTLYLTARVTEQEICLTDPSASKTTFDNFEEVESQIDQSLINAMQKMIDAKRAFEVNIISSDGTVFKNGTGSTTLTAKVLANHQDASGEMTYQWYKDGISYSTGQTLSVFAKDITNTVTYRVEAIDANNVVRGAAEVTCANVVDGDSSHIHIAYANSAEGSKDFSTSWFDGAMYFGVYTDDREAASETYTDYKWTRIKGEQGIQGPKGEQGNPGAKGDPGKNGTDGVSPIVSVSKSGGVTTISITDKNGTHTQTVNDGTDGTPGAKGADGKTPYFHVKYSNDGGKTFTGNSGEDVGTYIGTCTDYNSADPTTVSSYTWARIKGDTGAKGDPGTNGKNGEDGISVASKTMWYQACNHTKAYISKGRNLLVNSSHYTQESPYTTTSTSIDNYTYTYNDGEYIFSREMLRKGTEIYIQAKSNLPWSSVHGSDNTNKNKVGFFLVVTSVSKTSNFSNFEEIPFIKGDDTNTTLKGKYTLEHDGYIEVRLNTYSNGTDSVTGKFWDIKAEIGDTWTDWSPAFEDDVLISCPVGNRNLVEDTSNVELVGEYPSNKFLQLFYNRMTINVTEGTYILSFQAKSTVEGDCIENFLYGDGNPNVIRDNYRLSNGSTRNGPDGYAPFYLSTEYKKYWVKYTITTHTDYPLGLIVARLEAGRGTGTVSIKDIKLEYGGTPTDWSPAPEDLGWSTTTQKTTDDKKYLWAYEETRMSDDTTQYTSPIVIGTQGPRGPSGISVASVAIQYYLSNSSTSMAGGSWSADYPKWEPNKWVWIRQETTLSDGTKKYSDGKLWSNLNELYELETSNSAEIINANDSIKSTVEQVNTYHSELSEAIKSNADALDAFKANVSGTYATKSEIAQTSQSIQASIKRAISDSTYQTVSNVKLDESGLHVGTSNTQTESRIDGAGLTVSDADGNTLMNVTTAQSMIQNLKVTEKVQFGAHQIQAYSGEEADGTTVVGTAFLWIGDVK